MFREAFKKISKSWDFVPTRGAGVWPNLNFLKPETTTIQNSDFVAIWWGSQVQTKKNTNHPKNVIFMNK